MFHVNVALPSGQGPTSLPINGDHGECRSEELFAHGPRQAQYLMRKQKPSVFPIFAKDKAHYEFSIGFSCKLTFQLVTARNTALSW